MFSFARIRNFIRVPIQLPQETHLTIRVFFRVYQFQIEFQKPRNNMIHRKELAPLTLQGMDTYPTNREVGKIIFKMPFLGGYVNSLEGNFSNFQLFL